MACLERKRQKVTCVSWAPGFTLYNDDEASKYLVHAQARQIPSAALVESDFSLLLWKSGDEEPQRWLCAGRELVFSPVSCTRSIRADLSQSNVF